MTVEELKKFYGTQDKAAKAIGVSAQAVSLWSNGRIPTDFQIRWELDSKGRVKADIPKKIRNAA